MNLRIYNGVLQQEIVEENKYQSHIPAELIWQNVPVVNTQDTSSYNPEQSINTSKQGIVVPKGSRVLSREDVAKAFIKHTGMIGTCAYNILKELGFHD